MVVIVNFTKLVLQKYPEIEDNLKIARSKKTPEAFVKNSLRLSLYGGIAITVLVFFGFSRSVSAIELIFLMIAAFPITFFATLIFALNSPKSAIRKKEREVNREVLFAGRYLLVKIESGAPLVNSIEGASKSFGTSSKYFAEIINNINTGTPLEEALEKAISYSPSDKFKRIIWEILTTSKTGTEITDVMTQTLKAIAADQSIDIKRYGKKLNSLLLFYMILACVVPSLGFTMLIIISSFIEASFNDNLIYLILFFIAVVQFIFLISVRSSRPLVSV